MIIPFGLFLLAKSSVDLCDLFLGQFEIPALHAALLEQSKDSLQSLVILNALIVAVSRARESEVRERLHKLESIWEEYEVYETNQG